MVTLLSSSIKGDVEDEVVPIIIEDPEQILDDQHVDRYESGLLSSFLRETLNKMVHEILTVYPQSKYAIKKERSILHQRCRGRPGSPGDGSTYITFKWKHIKEATCVLATN